MKHNNYCKHHAVQGWNCRQVVLFEFLNFDIDYHLSASKVFTDREFQQSLLTKLPISKGFADNEPNFNVKTTAFKRIEEVEFASFQHSIGVKIEELYLLIASCCLSPQTIDNYQVRMTDAEQFSCASHSSRELRIRVTCHAASL